MVPVALHILKYTLRVKKQDTKLLPITSPNINRFLNFFQLLTRLRFILVCNCSLTVRNKLIGYMLCYVISKFASHLRLNIPPRLKHVATLPCKI